MGKILENRIETAGATTSELALPDYLTPDSAFLHNMVHYERLPERVGLTVLASVALVVFGAEFLSDCHNALKES